MIEKQGKVLDAIETKYWRVDHIQELVMDTRQIMEQKEKVLASMQELTEQLETIAHNPEPVDPQQELANYLSQIDKLELEVNSVHSPGLSPVSRQPPSRHSSGSQAAAPDSPPISSSISPSDRARVVSRMSERELRALALFNLKKKRADSRQRVLPTENDYPEVIPPLAAEGGERKLRRQGSQRRSQYSKSDPIESFDRLDTQISFSQSPRSHKRGSSLDPPPARRHLYTDDLKPNNSCILDYVTTPSSVSGRLVLHSRSISDHTTETSTVCPIPKNYRYSIKDFRFLAPVNSGSFGKICLVEMVSTGERYAMKIINSEEAIATQREEYVESEWNVFRQVNSEYIVRCYYTFYYAKFLCFVMEYLNGGDLSFFLKKYTLTEKVAHSLHLI